MLKMDVNKVITKLDIQMYRDKSKKYSTALANAMARAVMQVKGITDPEDVEAAWVLFRS